MGTDRLIQDILQKNRKMMSWVERKIAGEIGNH